MSKTWRPALLLALLAVVAAAPVAATDGALAIAGQDLARVLLPPGASVVDYHNAGYRLVRHGAEARIEVRNPPLGSTARFELPRRPRHDPVGRLARALSAGAETRYQAISRILGWVAGHVEYSLDRGQPQSAAAVLERRSGYCTGVARLTVALLAAVGIRAREVAGYVTGEDATSYAIGYHRWIEAHLPDRGWVFSDPLSTHHWVPATYVRLADDELATGRGVDGRLLARVNEVIPIDQYLAAGPGITARRNTERRVAGALRVRIAGRRMGRAELVGAGARRAIDLVDGATTFVGLAPGRYHLRLLLPGSEVLERAVELPDHAWTTVELTAPAQDPIPSSENPQGRQD